jgi:mannose-6-phosphate isomerase-like protein (cupin superfamily)
MKEESTDGNAERDRLELGRAIRAVRRARRLRLADVAGAAAVSVSLLSQVERGLLDPSLETLRKVAAALGTTPFRLLEPSAASGLVRAGQGRRLPATADGGMRFELLSPHLDGAFEVARWTLQPGCASSPEALAHPGEEANVILAGHALLELGDERVALGPGDCITFDARLPHRVVAVGDEPVVCIDVISPPSF